MLIAYFRRDTVSSVGLLRSKMLPGTADGMDHVCIFRHALALDERRVKFLPEYVNEGLSVVASGDCDSAAPATQTVPSAGPTTANGARGMFAGHVKPQITDEIVCCAVDPQDKSKAANTLNSRLAHTKEVWFAGTHSDM